MIVIHDDQITKEETRNAFYLTIDLKSTHPSKVSVYSSPLYISLNFQPYFYELDLCHRINVASSKVVAGEGKIVVEIVKQDEGFWEELRYRGKDLKERREKSRNEEQARVVKMKEDEIKAKREKERELVSRQIAVEQDMRMRVDKLKKSEMDSARNDIMEFARAKDSPKNASTVPKYGGLVMNQDYVLPEEQIKALTLQSILEDPEDSDSDVDLESLRTRIQKSLAKPTHCPPRQSTTTHVKVKFSDRGLIPTNAARESQDALWMTRIKLSNSMQKSSHPAPDSNSAEYYKQKGNGFFKLGDYNSAINVYSQAINVDSADASLYANRAAAYLKLSDKRAELDCTSGLEVISRERDILEELSKNDGQDELRHKLEVKLLIRRGACRVELMGNIKQGVEDYQKALELDPENEKLIKDVEMLKEMSV